MPGIMITNGRMMLRQRDGGGRRTPRFGDDPLEWKRIGHSLKPMSPRRAPARSVTPCALAKASDMKFVLVSHPNIWHIALMRVSFKM